MKNCDSTVTHLFNVSVIKKMFVRESARLVFASRAFRCSTIVNTWQMGRKSLARPTKSRPHFVYNGSKMISERNMYRIWIISQNAFIHIFWNCFMTFSFFYLHCQKFVNLSHVWIISSSGSHHRHLLFHLTLWALLYQHSLAFWLRHCWAVC